MLSVALVQTLTRFRGLPGMLPCGVRTFLGQIYARGHPADLDSYYTAHVLERYRKLGVGNGELGKGIRYWELGIRQRYRVLGSKNWYEESGLVMVFFD